MEVWQRRCASCQRDKREWKASVIVCDAEEAKLVDGRPLLCAEVRGWEKERWQGGSRG